MVQAGQEGLGLLGHHRRLSGREEGSAVADYQGFCGHIELTCGCRQIL